MGYNVKDYVRIRDEYTKKYQIARNRAEERRNKIHAEIPEIFEIDRRLSTTGMDIMDVIRKGGDTDKAIAELEKRNGKLLDERKSILISHGYEADYTDVHYDCDKCGDTGFVDTRMCECMKRALVRAGFESSGLGTLIGKQTFDNLDFSYYPTDRQDMMRWFADKLRSFAENFSSDTYANFIMMGGTGLGKTHMSTAVAEKVIERGHYVVYTGAVPMIRDLSNSTFHSRTEQSADVSSYYDCDLLIIDDLGTEVTNRFTQSCFYDIINERINKRKCTIINTNFSAGELNENYTERVTSRILSEYMPMVFSGEDIRKQKSLK